VRVYATPLGAKVILLQERLCSCDRCLLAARVRYA
jgi:hypothetical protein